MWFHWLLSALIITVIVTSVLTFKKAFRKYLSTFLLSAVGTVIAILLGISSYFYQNNLNENIQRANLIEMMRAEKLETESRLKCTDEARFPVKLYSGKIIKFCFGPIDNSAVDQSIKSGLFSDPKISLGLSRLNRRISSYMLEVNYARTILTSGNAESLELEKYILASYETIEMARTKVLESWEGTDEHLLKYEDNSWFDE